MNVEQLLVALIKKYGPLELTTDELEAVEPTDQAVVSDIKRRDDNVLYVTLYHRNLYVLDG